MENYESEHKKDFTPKAAPKEEVSAEFADVDNDDQWATLLQEGIGKKVQEAERLTDSELLALPEEQRLEVLRSEAVAQIKNTDRIQSTGGIDRYLDAPEEVWQGKRASMDHQSSSKIDKPGGIFSFFKSKPKNDAHEQRVLQTAQEIRQAIKIVDEYRAKKIRLQEKGKN